MVLTFLELFVEAGILFNEQSQSGKISYNSKKTTFHNIKRLQVVWFWFFSISSPKLSEELGHKEVTTGINEVKKGNQL